MTDSLEFKIATEDWEFDQINRLNYETFVREIPQHHSNPQKTLTDRFHDENTYIVCVSKKTVAGMIAVRSKRPFSLDQKLGDLDIYLPKVNSVCELRLLSIRKKFRRGKACYGLLSTAAQYCQAHGHDLAVISGAVKQQKLYEHLGFVPFGPVVGTQQASFQPMYLTLERYQKLNKLSPSIAAGLSSPRGLSLLPGPVEISQEVQNALKQLTISHRSENFLKIHSETKKLLCTLVSAKYVEIFMGSGTLANDVIAGQLSLIPGAGLVLSNGEFGERLIDQAKRLSLKFKTLSLDWGQIYNSDDIEKILHTNPNIKWLWAVHCETSTGMLNDIAMLKKICSENNVLLCLDCVSSIGTAHVDLHDVYLASGVSGKGLGAFSGLSMVFYNHKLVPTAVGLPAYLDLAYYSAKDGVPFTLSSNLLYALYTALEKFDIEERLNRVLPLSAWLKSELRQIGLKLITPDDVVNPFVITISLSPELNSGQIGKHLETKGFFLSFNSSYLLKRNWIQICLIGDLSQENLKPLLKNFHQLLDSETV